MLFLLFYFLQINQPRNIKIKIAHLISPHGNVRVYCFQWAFNVFLSQIIRATIRFRDTSIPYLHFTNQWYIYIMMDVSVVSIG